MYGTDVCYGSHEGQSKLEGMFTKLLITGPVWKVIKMIDLVLTAL